MSSVLRLSNHRWKHGRETVSEKAREILESGGGLSESQIAEFVARVDLARRRKNGEPPPRSGVDEMRELIETHYQSRNET